MTVQARSSANAGFDSAPVTVTVNPAPAPKPAAVETGFGDLDGTPAAAQQAAPTVNTAADTGEPEDPDPDLDARVAGLLANKSATNWNAVSAFMGAVVPWPASPQDDGWVNLHWSFPDKTSTAVPKTNVLRGGKPYKAIADFIKDLAWRLQRPEGFKDMFFCTSMQRDHKTSPNGTRRAAKSGAAALALKSIWVDIDVKAGDPRHYHTEAEALKAILLFAKTVGLPDPSAIVRSGGGLHVYWINTIEMTAKEWLPYAQGLKHLLLANNILADAGLTTDAARILRVPGTLNHKPKYPKPMPVELVPLTLNLYPFATRLELLKQFAGPVIAPTAQPVQHSIFVDGVTIAAFGKPRPEFEQFKSEPGLEAGIDKHEVFKVDPRPIFAKSGCKFYRDALGNGGADHDNNLWNIAVFGTTFMENGNDIAHKISSGHVAYSPDVTQALYDRKVAERATNVAGYPLCSTIKGFGCTSCATCPLVGKINSPLNIRPVVTATVTNASSPSGSFEQGPGSTSEITVNYVPGNEVPCRTALDNVVAADLSTFTTGDILTILRVPDQEKPGLERWGGDLPGTTPALPADIIERAERLGLDDTDRRQGRTALEPKQAASRFLYGLHNAAARSLRCALARRNCSGSVHSR